jgi:hypothetical protein
LLTHSGAFGQFNEIDRTTDATMLLFISQPDASPAGTHMLPSRNIRRSGKFMASATAARASFSQISSSRRRISRKRKLEAELRTRQDERMSVTSSTTVAGDLSPTSSSAAAAHDVMRKNIAAIEAMAERAENQGGENVLKGALRATLDSLRQMQKCEDLNLIVLNDSLTPNFFSSLPQNQRGEGRAEAR